MKRIAVALLLVGCGGRPKPEVKPTPEPVAIAEVWGPIVVGAACPAGSTGGENGIVYKCADGKWALDLEQFGLVRKQNENARELMNRAIADLDYRVQGLEQRIESQGQRIEQESAKLKALVERAK